MDSCPEGVPLHWKLRRQQGGKVFADMILVGLIFSGVESRNVDEEMD